MTDLPSEDMKNLAYIQEKLLPLDREIPIPTSVDAAHLATRLAKTPPLHVVRHHHWKRTVGLAAAFVLVLGGVFLSQGLPEMTTKTADMAFPAGAPTSATAAYTEETNQVVLAPEQDYTAIRTALEGIQGEEDYYRVPAAAPPANGGIDDPDTGGKGGGGGGDGGGGSAAGSDMKAGENAPRSALLGNPAAFAAETGYTASAQASGIQEADIVKADDENLYYLYTPLGEVTPILQVVRMDDLALTASISFPDRARVSELYVEEEQLAVMYQEEVFYTLPVYERQLDGTPTQTGVTEVPATTVEIYNLSAEQPNSVSKFTQQGEYVTSRIVDGRLVLVTDSRLQCNAHNPAVADEMLAPAIRNEAVSPEVTPVAPNGICIPAQPLSDRYTVVTSMDLQQPAQAVTKAVMGGTNAVMVSAQAVYLAGGAGSNANTFLAKYTLGETLPLDTATFSGYVPGTFALDEWSGTLRVAALQRDTAGQPTTTLYTFDDALAILGQLDGQPPLHTPDAIRFLGDTVYLGAGDGSSLLAADLSNPASPAVLGQTELPNAVELLHPVGERQMLAMGYDSGLTVSLLDLADPLQPKVIQTHALGASGSRSLALDTHKAFLQQGDWIGFPVTLYRTVRDALTFDRNGFGLFRLGEQLEPMGVLSASDAVSEDKLYADGAEVQRGSIRNNKLYLLSRRAVTAYSLDTLQQVGQVRLK